MARARNIKPGFFRNADLAELPYEARLLFIGLWTIADRSGRMEDRPKQIKMELFPADSLDVDALLGQLAAIGMVARYSHDGKRYLQVVNFAKHQNPHKDEKVSTIPDQDGHLAAPEPEKKKHRASTVQTPSNDATDTVAIGLIPDSLIPDSLILDSTPIGVGGDAAKPAADLTKDELWKAGKSLLEQSGMPKAQCGSFVGKLVKDYGDLIVVDAVRSAVLARPADPVEYLKATCMRSVGRRATVNKQEALEQRNRSVADAWANEGVDHATV
jgi:hypothetical protein